MGSEMCIRDRTTAVTNELATNDIRPVHLVSIGFSTPVNLTDASFDITSSVSRSSKTYSASAFLITVPTFTEETDVTKTTVNVALSGANTTFISTVLNENIVNDTVDIFRGFLNSSNAVIADPILLYSGNVYPIIRLCAEEGRVHVNWEKSKFSDIPRF